MTTGGRLNVLGMFGMPAVATLAAAITPALDSPGAGSFLTIFLMNLAVMLVGGVSASLLLRGAAKAGGAGSRIALLPSLAPALIGSAWYLYRSIVPETVAPGREILAVPLYLLLTSIGLSIAAWIACRMARAGSARR